MAICTSQDDRWPVAAKRADPQRCLAPGHPAGLSIVPLSQAIEVPETREALIANV